MILRKMCGFRSLIFAHENTPQSEKVMGNSFDTSYT